MRKRCNISNRVIRNAGWMIAGKISQSLINLIVGLLTARYLGPANYGLISYASAYTTFFSSICTLGINSVIVKELIDAPEKEGEVLGTSLGLRAISSALSAITIVGISFLLDANEPETQLVVALYSVSVIFHIFEVFDYWFQSRLQSKKAAMASLAAYVITSLYKIILLILDKPVTYFALATSVDYKCIAVILVGLYIRENGKKLSFSWDYGKDLLGKSCHYILSGLMVAVYAQTDKIMLKQMISDTENGYYATALSLCNVWCFILSAIISSLNPIIMQAHKEDKEKFRRLNRLLYCIVFYISAVVSVCFTVLGEWLIPVMYGEAYLPAAMPLKILTWQTAFSYLGVARNAWIVCENKQKYLKYIYISAALANVVLNCLFIPVWGASGAAFASLAAQITTVMIAPFFIKQMRENSVMMVDAMLLRGIR